VILDASSGDVLMVGFMNDQALQKTRETGFTHFWSRSRNALWKKGETSGHVQEVVSISVNCELNALLVKVRQAGAVCHEGYATCFFREIGDDGSLRLTHDRVFDPPDVYGEPSSPLSERTRLWYGAYEFLRDHDLTAVSKTSTLLRESPENPPSRVADELEELAQVLRGLHSHTDPLSDTVLEGSQCLYWLAVSALVSNLSWESVRPDRALLTNDADVSVAAVAALLESGARRWRNTRVPVASEEVFEAFTLISQAAESAHINPLQLLDVDLAELRSKPYLDDYCEKAGTQS
jgi:phosphoribosyl-AMP cyclohydrolase